jgi:hypothetical protein
VRPTLVGLVAAIAVVVAGCQPPGGSFPSESVLVVGPGPSGGLTPVVVTPEFGVGRNHFVFTLIDATNAPVASPDRNVTLLLTQAGGASPATSTPVVFEWGITGSVGFYISDVDFPSAGTWQANFAISGPGSSTGSATLSFDVKAKTSAVAIGQPAPSVKTPIATDVGGDLAKISTDTKPDPRFYTTSEDAALAAHEPFVLVFATPAFCQSATCGPALDHVKSLATDYPNLTFIHVEPYKMAFTDGSLQPVLDNNGHLQTNAVTDTWGILSEPWIYVVGGDGIVVASFPSVFSDEEFKTAASSLK